MNVIAFNGSPNSDGGVAHGIAVMKRELENDGVAVEVIHLGNRSIRGCMDCRKCRELKRCAIEGDPVNEYLDKIASADGLILGSPVYYGGVAGTFKCFLDRLFFIGPKLKFKVGAAVVSVRRTGGIAAIHQLNNYFLLSQMIITPGVYWDVIHGRTLEEQAQDEEGLQIMEIQGRNMAWLLKAVAKGREDLELPPSQKRKLTNFIH